MFFTLQQPACFSHQNAPKVHVSNVHVVETHINMTTQGNAAKIDVQSKSKLGASLPISSFAKAKLGHNPNWNKSRQNAKQQAQQRRFKLNKLKKKLAKQGQLPPRHASTQLQVVFGHLGGEVGWVVGWC